jgi:ribose transport system permease protein
MPVQEKTGAGVGPGTASPTDTDAATGFARVGRGLEAVHELRLGRFSAVGLLILFVVLFGILRPEIFLTLSNFQVTVSQGVETVILGLAFLVPLCAGAYDLSIGAVMELSLATLTWGTLHTGLPVALLAILSVLLCCLVGMVSGVLVVKFGVNSLIATLGISEVLAAAELLVSNNTVIVGNFPTSFTNLGNHNVAEIPLVLIYLLAIALVIWFVLEQTPAGRSIFAVGGNAEAARLAGVRSDAVIFKTLVASAGISGIAGVVYAMQVGTYSAGAGAGLLFPALAAVFFGASQFSGRPNVWGTVVAFFALAFGVKGLQIVYGPGSFWIDPLFQGLALVIAVSFASRQVYQTRRSRREDAKVAAIAGAAEPQTGGAGGSAG